MSERALVLKISMSVDGFVASPEGEIDWIFPSLSADAVDWLVQTLSGASLHLMGSRTFKGMAGWWPRSDDPYAAPMNEIPKAVFSSNPRILDEIDDEESGNAPRRAQSTGTAHGAKIPFPLKTWKEAQILSGNISDGVLQLKRKPGAYILAHGGASFVRSLIAGDLIDEYRLLVHPLALGRGLSIFSDLRRRQTLKLIEAQVFQSGALVLVYRATRL